MNEGRVEVAVRATSDIEDDEERELAELRRRCELPDPWLDNTPPRKAKKAKRRRPRRRPQSRTPAGLQREARDREAVDLRRRGHSYQVIADALDLAGKGSAHKMVTRGLKRCAAENAHHYLRWELVRLEAIRQELARRVGALDEAD